MRRAFAHMHSPVRIVWLGVALLGLLVGCIRPVEPEQTGTPDGNLTISNPGSTAVTVNSTPLVPTTTPGPPRNLDELTTLQVRTMSIAVANLLNEPVQEGTFDVYGVFSTRSGDEIYGASFRNPSSLPCVAVLLMRPNLEGGLDYIVGDKLCATELGANSVVASILLISGTDAYIATLGEIFLEETVTEILIVFPDGSSRIVQADAISENRFLHVRPDIFTPAELVGFFDASSVQLLEVVP